MFLLPHNMQFFNDLDSVGQSKFLSYVNSYNDWLEYIEPIATINFHNALKKLNKLYIAHSYFLINKKTNANINSDIKKLYRKLSAIFHPDKFIRTDKIFIIIQSLLCNGNFNHLSLIDSLTTHILNSSNDELNTIVMILPNYNVLQKLCNFINSNPNSNISDFDYINCDNDNKKTFPIVHNFSNTNAYFWYIGLLDIDKCYWSKDELISHLTTNFFSIDEFQYYFDLCDDDTKAIVQQKISQKNGELILRSSTTLKEIKNNLFQQYYDIIMKSTSPSEDILCYLTNNFVELNEPIDLREKFNCALKSFFENYTMIFHRVKKILSLNNSDVNKFIIEYIQRKFNKYIDLPPYNKSQYDNVDAIGIIFRDCYSLLIEESKLNSTFKELYNKVLSEYCNTIKRIDINDCFYDIIKEIEIPEIKETYHFQYNNLLENIPYIDYTGDTHKLKSLCCSFDERIRKKALSFLNENKEKYFNVYNLIYNIKS